MFYIGGVLMNYYNEKKHLEKKEIQYFCRMFYIEVKINGGIKCFRFM